MYMAINQYGDTYHGLEYPRKDLLERLCRKHADKMYVDSKDGSTFQTGYVIGREWLTVYKVFPMRKAV